MRIGVARRGRVALPARIAGDPRVQEHSANFDYILDAAIARPEPPAAGRSSRTAVRFRLRRPIYKRLSPSA
jgi:hypothetical protein